MSITELISDIVQEKPVFFIGAGISFNSGIPTVYPLKKAILTEFGFLSEDEIDEIASFEIPFESFISSLLADCSSISKLLNIYSYGKPNLNHYLIAYLSKLGFINTVITTNFDTLLEQAFKEIGNTNFEVVYTQKKIRKIDYKSGKTILIKIHGCASSKRTISTTLNRVANRNGIDYREKIVQRLFEETSTKLISMGYSYSDSFDINPIIDKCEAKKKYIYILGHTLDKNEIRTNKDLKTTHILKNFDNTKEICTDFDKLVLEIWTKFIQIEPHKISNRIPVNSKQLTYNKTINSIKDWKNEVQRDYSVAALYSMVADIYLKASDYDKTEYYYNKAISYSNKVGNIENELHYSIGLAMLHDNRGNYDDVIEIVLNKNKLLEKQKSNIYLDEYWFDFYRMNFLTYLGKAYQCQTLFKKSEKPIIEALSLAKKTNRKNNEAYISTLYAANLAGLENYEKALTIFKRAESIYLNIGDVAGLSFNYSENSKLFKEINDYKNSAILLHKSLSISQNIGNTANEAIDLSDLALLYLLSEDYEESKKCFNLAFKLYSQNEDIVGEAICFNNYAHFLYKKGKLIEAITYHKKALKILEEYNYIPSIKIAYENLILIYSDLENSEEKNYYKKKLEKIIKANKKHSAFGN